MNSRTPAFTRLVVAGALVVTGAASIAPAPTPASAATVTSISPTLSGGQIGILGATYGSVAACPGYTSCVSWTAGGAVTPSLASLSPGPNVRLDLYPHVANGTYDPWTAAAGGV